MPRVEKERGLAARVAGCAELRDVRLFAANVDLTSPSVVNGLAYSLDTDIEFQTVGEDVVHAVVVTGNYELSVIEPVADEDEEDDSEPAKVAGVSFTLAAMYSLQDQATDPQAFKDEEFEAFAATTGQFALYPYAREFVADMTGRMGLPTLHMGPLRFALDDPNSD